MRKAIATLATVGLIIGTGGIACGKETKASPHSSKKDDLKFGVVEAELKDDGMIELKVRSADGETKKIYLDTRNGDVIEAKNISVDQAVRIAQQEVPGDVIEVEYERGRYEVKIRANDGGLKELYVDARNGAVIRHGDKE